MAATESIKKCCTGCGLTKPLSEFRYFPSRKNYRPRCKECLSAEHRQWNQKARHLTVAHSKKWKLANQDKHRAYTAQWKLDNPEKARAQNHKRRAGGSAHWSEKDVQEIFALQRGLCAACRTKLDKSFHRDHIVPLARGGSNDRKNIQLLCKSCNSQKWAKDPVDFMRGRGLLL